MSSFKGKKVVVTGGTGSFGSTMVRHLLENDAEEVRVFSRDELKQDNLRRDLGDSRVKFILGDTRDIDSMRHLFNGVDFVFHAAALKQVPSGDFFPLEVVKTNVLGSSNVIHAAESAGVESLVVLSTDKAVYPINAMGMSKALMEKVAISEARRIGENGMKISVTRYGNVMMSRGSVIPAFLETAKESGTVRVTNKNMTRFMMSLEESVDLVQHAMFNSNQGSLFVRKAPAASLEVLVQSISLILGEEIRQVKIGTRHGEKLHETLVSSEEMANSKESENYFEIPLDDRDLDYSLFFESGTGEDKAVQSFTSANANQLSPEELAKILRELKSFQGVLD